MKLAKMNVVLREREVVGNMYIYTYINLKNQEEIKIGKMIPVTKEVVIEGDNNEVELPVIPEKIVIKGNDNKVKIVDNDDILEVPFFLTPEYKKDKNKRDFFNKLFNR